MPIDENTQSGTWEIVSLEARDEYDNYVEIKGRKTDLSAAEFTVYENKELIGVEALPNITVISRNTTVSNRTIEGDVYIGPNAYVTMNSVIITGKLYVMGVLEANSIAVQELHALRVLRGSVSNYMGTVMLYGACSIPHTIVTSDVIEDIPYNIQENPARVIDGKLTMKGAALDFADITINGNAPTYNENGKFIYEQDWEGGSEVTLTFIVPYYEVTRTVTIPIVEMTTTGDGNVQFKPIIETAEVTLQSNQDYDLTKLISASDEEDGDLSDVVKVVEDTIDITIPGTYTATVSVTDSAGAVTEKQITVKVISTLESISLNKNELTLNKGSGEQLTVNYHPADTTDDRTVIWSSGDESVATVDEAGNVTAIAGGTTQITAKVGEKEAVCQVKVEVPLESIVLSKTEATLIRGETGKLEVSFNPADTTVEKHVQWTSSNEKVVTVDEEGNISAVGNGEAEVKAVAGGKEAICKVTVILPLESISLNKEKLKLERGASETLEISYKPEDTTDSHDASWTSSDESVATVAEDGKVTAAGLGTAVITVEVQGKIATCEVTVHASLQSIELNKTETVLVKGTEEKLSVSYTPEDTTDPRDVVWESSDEKIVTVDKEGKMTAVAGGKAKITAVVGTKKASCEVTVVVPLESITLDKKEITLEKGTAETLKLTYNPSDTTDDKTVVWGSEDESVATVDEAGQVTAIGAGETTVTATVGETTAQCRVKVEIALVSISLNKEKVTLNKGEEETLSVSYKPEDTTSSKEVQWSSSDESVATVDGNGKLRAVAAGKVNITATVGDKTAVCEVMVKVPLKSISLNKTELVLERSSEETLQVSFQPLDTTVDRTVAWSSSDESIATVDETGKVTAIMAGETVITAEVNGKTSSCKVRVIPIPVKIKGIVTDPEGPQKAGTKIKVSADVTGDKEGVKYKFVWHKNNWEQWDVLQHMSEKDTAVWQPVEPGSYTLIIDIEETDGKKTSVEKNYIITENPWSVKGLTTNVESPQKPETAITLKAEVEGGAGLQYKFVWHKNNWEQWDVVQDMSEKNSAVWTPETAGEYTLIVDVKDPSGKQVSVQKNFIVREDPWKAIGIKTNLVSPQKVGTEVELAADVEGGKGLKYKFVWQKNNWEQWDVIQQMSEKDNAVWIPKEAGVYTIYMDVKDRSGNTETVQRTFEIQKRMWNFEEIVLQSNAILTGESLNAEVKLSGDTVGLEYKFVWEKDGWKDWKIIQDFSANNKAEWTPEDAGDYTLYVDIRDIAGKTQTKTMKYIVDEMVIQTENISLGQEMQIRCKSKKEGQQYKFVWEKDNWKKWGVIQDLGTANEVSWMPEETGKYMLYIDVKNPVTGEQFTKTKEVNVTSRNWTFKGILAPAKVSAGESFIVSLDAAGVTTGQQYKFVWEKDNWNTWGVMKEMNEEPSVEWKFEEKGTYTVYLDVKELDGSQVTKTRTIIVE